MCPLSSSFAKTLQFSGPKLWYLARYLTGDDGGVLYVYHSEPPWFLEPCAKEKLSDIDLRIL